MSSTNLVRAFGLPAICMTALLTWSGVAWSALNKCTGADGMVTYTEQPCAQNQSKATVKISVPPAQEGPASAQRKSPRQVAQCERARKAIESLKVEVSSERHKDETELVANAKQEIARAEQLIRAECP